MCKVRDDLRAVGLQVWTDEGIEPGTVSWKEAIEKAIRQTHMVVVLLSPDANDSIWVQREIDYAEVRHKPIIPVLISGQPRDAIPFALAGSQFIDVRKQYEKNIKTLKKRCINQLEINDAITLVNRPEVTLPIPVRRKQKRNNMLQILNIALMLTLATLFIGFKLNQNNQGDVQASEEVSTNYLLLRYNYDTLVLMNYNESLFLMDNITFEMVTDSNITQFDANNWNQSSLNVGRCLQVWRPDYTYLPPDIAPADACFSRVGYRSTRDIFWVNENLASTFVVRRFNDVLGTCTTIANMDDDITTCRINL